MDTNRTGAPRAGGRNPSKNPASWQRHSARLLVPAIAVALGALLVASGWETLRPTTRVRVAPAVFISGGGPPAQPADESETHAAPSGRAAQAAGWLEADPFLVACSVLADGVVAEITALEGDRVEAGQVVARLIDDDARLALVQSEARLALTQAGVAAAEAGLAAAEGNWEHPVERDRLVMTSRAQLRETEAELSQLPSLVTAERATLARLNEELIRLEAASASGAASSFELMITSRRTQSQQASVEALEGRAPILTAKRDRLQAEVTAAARNAELRISERRALGSARAELARAQAERAQARGIRDEAQLWLERMTIRAPISGYVQRRLKVPGDKAMLNMDSPHSAHLFHLYDPARLQVRVDVPLADAGGIVVGQQCEVVVEVLPDFAFEGVVSRITHEADFQKNTLQVKVGLRDPKPLLRPEMLARVKFLAGEGVARSSDAPESSNQGAVGTLLRIPESAIVTGTAGSSAWVVRDRQQGRGVVSPIALELGRRDAGWVEVSGDLCPGDLLVISQTQLSPGQRVRIVGDEGGAG